MKKITKIIAIVALMLASLVVAPVHAEACSSDKSGLSISPVNQPILLEPGSERNYTFEVQNIGEAPATFKVYAQPYSMTGEEYTVNFSDTENKFTQLARWITVKDTNGQFVEKATFQVEACGKTEVEYHVSVPANVASGGQYAVIFAEGMNAAGGGGIKAVPRVGLVIYGHATGVTVRTYELVDFAIKNGVDETLTDASGNKITKSVIHASVKINNTGNVDLTANTTLTAKNVFGTVLYQGDSASIVLPETSRKVTSVWEKTPLFGLFNVTYTVNIAGEIKDFSTMILIMPAFIVVIILILIAGATFWVVTTIKKQRERKGRRA